MKIVLSELEVIPTKETLLFLNLDPIDGKHNMRVVQVVPFLVIAGLSTGVVI